jgi:hypothetical protein
MAIEAGQTDRQTDRDLGHASLSHIYNLKIQARSTSYFMALCPQEDHVVCNRNVVKIENGALKKMCQGTNVL